MRILLFGLTGFGNAALRGCRGGGEVVALFTRREPGPYPYYPETDLAAEGAAAGIPVGEEPLPPTPAEAALLGGKAPDLLLVASYHRRIPAAWRESARLGAINLHPALLPAYRGASPTAWCLIRGETETGVTAHYLAEELDAGPIILQRRVAIEPAETDGSLRRKLAAETEAAVRELLRRLQGGARLPATAQDPTAGSYYPRRTASDALIEFTQPVEAIRNRVRASLPYPGPRARLAGGEIRIRGAEVVTTGEDPGPPGRIRGRGPGWVEVAAQGGSIRLLVEAEAPTGGEAAPPKT